MPDCAKLVPLVEKLIGVNVLVIGDAMLDHYILGSVDRISPEAPVPILRVEQEFERVGGAANVAANITSLRGNADLFALGGKVGKKLDADGMRLGEMCALQDIQALFLPALPCTVRKARMVAGQQQMLRVDWEHPYKSEKGKKLELGKKSKKIRSEELAHLLKRVHVVVVSDYAKGMVDSELMADLRASGKPVIVDPRPQNKELYRGVSLITPNRKEATEMLGVHKYLSGEELGMRLAKELESDILVTLGEEGMCLCRQGKDPFSIPTRAREVYDVTGAGDTVVATFALALGAGGDLKDAAKLANAAAGVVVGHVGCASIRPDDLKEALMVGNSLCKKD